MSSQAALLRDIVYRLLDQAKLVNDMDTKRALAERACTYAQEAELAVFAEQDWWVAVSNMRRYRKLLAAGVIDPAERRIFENLLVETEIYTRIRDDDANAAT